MLRTILFILLYLAANTQFAQNSIPTTQLTSLEGLSHSTEDIFKTGQPILLVFWATWCSHTTTGLTEIQDDYFVDWVDDHNLKVVATDDAKTSNSFPLVANSSGWDYEMYSDINGDFRRAMGINNAPYLILFNAQGEIVWQQNAYFEGDAEIINAKLAKM
ncbi:MAG: TlpA family protein disulfide reductase [Fluviicola sp.]